MTNVVSEFLSRMNRESFAVIDFVRYLHSRGLMVSDTEALKTLRANDRLVRRTGDRWRRHSVFNAGDRVSVVHNDDGRSGVAGTVRSIGPSGRLTVDIDAGGFRNLLPESVEKI